MKFFTDLPAKILQYLEANRITILVWLLIVIVILAGVSANRANKAQTLAKLTSADASVREDEVLQLANSRALADALTDTEDPNAAATDPQNVKSVTIREAAATTLNSLITQKKVATDVALDNLYMLRKDADSGVKTTSTAGLAKVGQESDANLKMIVNHLSDGDPDVRSASSDALSKIGGARAAELVAPLVPNAAASDSAIAALTGIGKPSIPFLTPMLADKDVTLRSKIISTLAAIGDASAIPSLEQQVNAQPPIPTVHREAIIAISQIVLKVVPAPGASPATAASAAATPPVGPSASDIALCKLTTPIFIKTLADTSEDSFARSRSALALGRLGGPEATASLVAALGDFDSRVASAALTGVQQVGGLAVPSLAAATSSPNVAVRIEAASALGGIGNATALSAISRSLGDKSADVRMAAATALGTSGNKSAVPLLIASLSDSSGLVAGAASNSLHLLGAQAVPALIQTLASANQTAAFYASQSLQHIGPSTVPALIAAASSSAPDLEKTWVAVTLGTIRDNHAKDALTTLALTAFSPRTRWAASQALQQIGSV